MRARKVANVCLTKGICRAFANFVSGKNYTDLLQRINDRHKFINNKRSPAN
jgi:hypothetical protein